MEKNLVSVIIPCYNHEKYVQETINSIISQAYQNIEIIVVDDGSKDNSWQKIQEMKEVCEKRFKRVHFETKENEGTCKTLNRLLSLSNGEYIYLIASDDLAKPSAIEKEFKFLSQNSDYSLVVGDNEIIDCNSKQCYWDKKRNITYNPNTAKYKTFGAFLKNTNKLDLNSNKFGSYEKLYCSNHIPNGYLIRKEVFEKIGNFTPDAPLEDYWMMLQISKYSKIKYLNEILFAYRWHDANTIKDSAKIKTFANKTREYEINLLKNADFTKTLPDVEKVYKKGAIFKKIGIPFIFEISTIFKDKIKFKRLKIFNFKVADFNVKEL